MSALKETTQMAIFSVPPPPPFRAPTDLLPVRIGCKPGRNSHFFWRSSGSTRSNWHGV